MNTRTLAATIIGVQLALSGVIAGGIAAAAHGGTPVQPATSAPVIVQCVETVDSTGGASLNRCGDPTVNRAAVACARAAFLADDYAHTHTGARHEHRAVRHCAAMVGGF